MNTNCHTDQIANQADAIRWFIDNRRTEVSIEQAIRNLRVAMHGDSGAQDVLDRIARAGSTK